MSQFNFLIDADSNLPIWQQLYLKINQVIEQGLIDVGQGLPSERELAQQLNISRGTVRRCYDELRAQQRLVGEGRRGSILQKKESIHPKLGKLKSFTQEMAEIGKTASTKVELIQVIEGNIEISQLFARPRSAQFLHVVRIRYGDDIAMSREVAWYDLTQAPALKEWDGTGSVYEFLNHKCHIQLVEANQTVQAHLSNTIENQAFGFEQSFPCLLFKRQVFSQYQHLIEYVEGTFRGDLYVYSLDLSL